MVYGLNVKPEWGHYPKVKTHDGDSASAKAIITPDGGVGTGGFPRETANLPKRVTWSVPNRKPVPDFDQTPMLNVSERARRVIEGLEPGVHQFVPVEYYNKKGMLIENRYWFVVCNRIDSLDREHTTMILSLPMEGWCTIKDAERWGIPIPDHLDPGQPSKIVFNLRQIGCAHMWHDKYLGSGEFMSDHMAEEIQKAGLTGLRLENSRVEAV